MKVHKYPVGSLLLTSDKEFVGYIQSQDENFYGEPLYNIYWFNTENLARNVNERYVELGIKHFKDKYELSSW